MGEIYLSMFPSYLQTLYTRKHCLGPKNISPMRTRGTGATRLTQRFNRHMTIFY